MRQSIMTSIETISGSFPNLLDIKLKEAIIVEPDTSKLLANEQCEETKTEVGNKNIVKAHLCV